MKLFKKTLLAIVAGSLMTAGAQAAVTYGNGMTAQPYLGVKVGQYDIDADDADDATSYGVYGGAKFTPNFGAELEYMTTSDTDIDSFVSNGVAVNSEYSADMYGLYATYNYAFVNTPVYVKGRLGFANNEIDIDLTDNVSEDYSDSGIAGGIGLGYGLMQNASIEAMYNMYPSIEIGDEDFDASGITLGAHFKF